MVEKFISTTDNRTMKDWMKAIAILLLGLIIAHLGVTMFLLSELGTDTFTVLIQGLARTFHTSVGTMHVMILVLLMIIMLATTKGYVKIGTMVCAFCGGPIIDLFTLLLAKHINGNSHMVVRISSVLGGCMILALGMSVVINSKAGTGPNDLIAIILSDKIGKVEFRWVRVGCDLFFVLLGFTLGGTVGIGTIIAVFLTGPAVQFWLPKTKKVFTRLV